MENIKPLKKIGNTKKKGTCITFLPSKAIFSSTNLTPQFYKKE